MLHLRLSATPERAESVQQALTGADGVRRVAGVPASDGGLVVDADLELRAADDLIKRLEALGVPAEDFVLSHVEVVAPAPAAQSRIGTEGGFAWIEVIGEARANARPFARYLVLMGVAAVIAALGVIVDNSILIVGAMATSPDLLPLCSICVGLVGRRPQLARLASVTLGSGLMLVAVIAALLTLSLDATGILPGDFAVGEGGLGTLATIDYSTVLVALAAGVAAILTFETRASGAVGVAISVATIPASAFTGVAIAAGDVGGAGGALLVLATNVCLLILSGSATLAAQPWLARHRPGGTG